MLNYFVEGACSSVGKKNLYVDVKSGEDVNNCGEYFRRCKTLEYVLSNDFKQDGKILRVVEGVYNIQERTYVLGMSWVYIRKYIYYFYNA
jgi:hypothetical protein